MESKKIRKYNTIYRKKLVENLNKITDNEILLEIYNIIVEDIGQNYSSNKNGIFINLNLLSNLCIDKLEIIIEKYKNINTTKNDNVYQSQSINYKLDDIELFSEMGHKLTNQEKIYMKKIKKNL